MSMCRIISTSLLLLCCLCNIKGQDTLDSFLSRTDISFEAKADRLNTLARELSYVNPLRGTELSYQALQISQSAGYTRGIANALRGIASSMLTEERIYLCLKNLQRSLSLFKKINDSAGIAGCYVSLGHLYRRLKDQDKELLYHTKAFDYFSRHGSPERIGVTTHNLGETYYLRGDYAQATALTNRAIILNDSIGNLTVLSACYRVLGDIKIATSDKKAATYWYRKTLDLSDQLGAGSQKVAKVEALMSLAKLATEKNQDREALTLLQQALQVIKENRLFKYVQPIFEAIIRNQTKQGALTALNQTLDDFTVTSNSLNNVKNQVMSRFTQTMLEIDSLEQKTTELEQKNISQNKLIEEKNSRTRMTIIFLLCLVLLALALTFNVFRLRKINRNLTEQRSMVRKQNLQLEELNALKNKFLSILSHDIKAPLQGLKSYAQLLKNGGEQIHRGELLVFGSELEQQVEHTTKMADHLILWAKLQMKKESTQPQTISLLDSIGEITRLYKKSAQDKQLAMSVHAHDQATVWADPNQFNFMIRNLIYNAIKYCTPGGKVDITTTKGNNSCLIKITDTGEGFHPETIHALQSNASIETQAGTAGEAGTGLGLRICQEFAKLNRGSISIGDNPLEKGACIILELPHLQPLA